MSNIRTQAVPSERGRVIVGRILPGADLIKGIRKVCQDNQVTSGTIVAAIGSLVRAQFIYAVPDKNAKMGIKYSEPVRVDGPLEVLACQGTIGLTADGQLGIHLHGLMSDPDMKVYGGHFLEDGNPVLVTVELLIHENQDARTVREQDDETDFPVFRFYAV
jgi:predicted DNA-binding protein with PD1-like motif